MTIDVYAADEQSDHQVDLERWVQLARAVLEHHRIPGDVEVSLLFVDEGAIAELNQHFLGHEGATDVLSFPIEDDPLPPGRSPDSGGSGPGAEPAEDPLMLLGDVVICPAVAVRNAAEHEVNSDDELALLVVHGLLHLLGMDHEETGEAEAMEALEQELLARYHKTKSSP